MGFDWKDILLRTVATFFEAVVAYLTLNFTGVVDVALAKGALFAGIAAAAAFVWNVIRQYYGIRQAKKAALAA